MKGTLAVRTLRSWAMPLLAIPCAAVAGCGASSSPPPAPSAILEHAGGGLPARIVLSPLGAQRIGLRTATALAAPAATGTSGTQSVIPFSAIVYDPSGATFAFVALQVPRTFTEMRIKVARVDGSVAYLRSGPRPGAKVVSVGAEELYGVQSGVLAQT